jgi:glycosyltransferase involved in cell wall biosynthesis
MTTNVFMVSNMYPSLQDSRYGVFVYKLVRGLRRRGIRVADRAVISGKPNGSLQKLAAYCALYCKIVSAGLTREFDLLFLHYPPYVILPSWIVARLRRKRLVASFHGSDLTNLENRGWIDLMNALTMRVADFVVCPSEHFRHKVLERSARTPGSVIVFPSCGVDRRRFNPSVPRTSRAALGLQEGEFAVGFVSVLSREKGIFEFLDAIKALARTDPSLRAVVIGDGPERDRVRAIANEPELKGRVIVTGKVRHAALPAYYAALDCFVFPTHLEESLGLVALEALASGVPVAATRKGATPEYIVDGKNGALFDPVTPAAIAAAVEVVRRAGPWDRHAVASTVERYDAERVLRVLTEDLDLGQPSANGKV